MAPLTEAPLTVRFDLTEEEHARACRSMATRSVHSNLLYGLLLFLPIALGVGAHVATGGRARVGPFSMWWFGMVVAASLLGLAWVISLFAQRSGYRSSPLSRGTFTFAFDATDVRAEGPGLSSSVAWSSLHRIVQTPEFILLYVSSASALVLPKRAMAPADQVLFSKLAAEGRGTL